MTSPYDDPAFRAWAQDRKDTVLAMLDSSSTTAAILSPPFTLDRLDVAQALEIGAALLLDKPLILVVEAGVACPSGLAAAAAQIVEMDQPLNLSSIARRVKEAMDRVLGSDEDDE